MLRRELNARAGATEIGRDPHRSDAQSRRIELCAGDEVVVRENNRHLHADGRRAFVKNLSQGTVVARPQAKPYTDAPTAVADGHYLHIQRAFSEPLWSSPEFGAAVTTLQRAQAEDMIGRGGVKAAVMHQTVAHVRDP